MRLRSNGFGKSEALVLFCDRGTKAPATIWWERCWPIQDRVRALSRSVSQRWLKARFSD
jgi:hypothetical protein